MLNSVQLLIVKSDHAKKYTTIFFALLQFTAKMYPQKPLAKVERSKLQQFRFTITFLVQENGGRRIKCLSGHK